MSARARGLDEEKLAREWEFNSAQDLFQRIKEDGHPICPVCGATYVDETHCRSSEDLPGPQKEKTRPKAKTFGEKTPLPPPEQAVGQFGATLSSLEEASSLLRGRKDYLQSGRFIAEREEGNGKRRVWGAQKAPPEPLTTLIAIEALAAGSASNPRMEHLLDVLHPEEKGLEQKGLEQLEEWIEKLELAAANVALLVRGGTLRSGRKSEPVSATDHSAVRVLQQLIRDGHTDEEIVERTNRRLYRGPLREAAASGAEDFTLEDVERLKDMDF